MTGSPSCAGSPRSTCLLCGSCSSGPKFRLGLPPHDTSRCRSCLQFSRASPPNSGTSTPKQPPMPGVQMENRSEGRSSSSGGRIRTCDLRVVSRSLGFSAGFALFRPMPETPSDQALCGFGFSAVPGRLCRSQGLRHPYGTHRSVLEASASTVARTCGRHADHRRSAGSQELPGSSAPSRTGSTNAMTSAITAASE